MGLPQKCGMIGVMGREEHCISRCQTYRGLKLCRAYPLARSVRHHPIQWGHRLHGAIDGYAGGIVRLIGESYGRHTVQRAWKEFNINQTGQPFSGYDANAELFYSWLFHKWTPARERGHEVRDDALYGVPPTRAYLDRSSTSLNPLLRTYLEACLVTSARFYEVLDCEVGVSFRARDVFTDASCIVSETLASTSLQPGDILYAHLIPIGQITLMEAISPQSFPPQSKRHLLRLRQEPRAREHDGPELRRVYFTLTAAESL
jgi:hypothetical protein